MKSWFFICLLVLVGLQSQAQDMLIRISEKSKDLPFQQTSKKILDYAEQIRKPHLPAEQLALIQQYNQLNNGYKDSILQYIQTNPTVENAAVLPLSYYFDIRTDSGFLRKSLLLFHANNVDNQYTQYMTAELNGLDSAQVGKTIPSFSLLDINGKTQIFPNGQKTLFVFWASWCVPCRAENETLKTQYATIQQRGIQIASINLDEDKNRWLLASKQDQLPWANAFAGQGFSSRIARFFTIHQIPQNVLLDESGKILARNIGLNQLVK